MINKKIAIFLGMISALLLKANFVLALEVDYPSILGLRIDSSSTFPDYVCYFFGLGINLAFFVAVVSVILGGVSYLISYGRGKFVDDSKDWIKAGVLGLLIVTTASIMTYTINPELNNCKAGVLSVIPSIINPTPPTPSNRKIDIYREIPIGTLTENLLARTMGCYEFDQEGNPVDFSKANPSANPVKDDSKKSYLSPQYFIPTYLNHDRIDCLLQLADGAQKKTQVIANLSNEIYKLMDKCSCRDKCTSNCDPSKGGCDIAGLGKRSGVDGECPASDPSDRSAGCTGACVFPKNPPYGMPCQQKPSTTDCCDVGVKEKIEHGPIIVKTNVSGADGKCSSSADCPAGEFCNPLDGACFGISSGSKQACTSTSNCPAGEMCFAKMCVGLFGGSGADCSNGKVCPNSNEFCVPLSQKCMGPNITDHKSCFAELTTTGLDEFRCQSDPGHGTRLKTEGCDNISNLVETPITVGGKTIGIIDQTKWKKLNLLQQLTYFKEKINILKLKIQQDKVLLEQARTDLGNCYLATPYIDLFKAYEGAYQKEQIVLTQKTFFDPETSKAVDPSKYCAGFNYNNSSCLKKCNDICPDDSPGAINLYKSSPNTIDAYNKRPCSNGSYPTFKDCISACQVECTTNCATKYQACSSDYNTCKNQCNSNSQCVINNENSCLINSSLFKDCAQQIQIVNGSVVDQGNADFCIDNAYLCKNGSEEHAGYFDCANPKPTSLKIPVVSCSQNYSSSFLYDHPECQKCDKPYEKPKPDSVCYGTINAIFGSASCQDLCPEVTKCPSSSDCPNCPCNKITDQTSSFSVPVNPIGTYNVTTKKVSASEIVGAQCNEYSYDDDPLTFYCKIDWLTDPNREGLDSTPLGENMTCSKSKEVPLGQTVDDAKKWVDTLIKTKTPTDSTEGIITTISSNIASIISKITVIGNAYKTPPILGYCTCSALNSSEVPICHPDCFYSFGTRTIPIYDSDGKKVGTRQQPYCSCTSFQCRQNPCLQIMAYLQQVWASYGLLKDKFITFYVSMLTEPRSDIIKELAYSRKTADACSLAGNSDKNNFRLLSCTRVEDELMPTINTNKITYNGKTFPGYCYGRDLGNYSQPKANPTFTDNWFCCENVNK